MSISLTQKLSFIPSIWLPAINLTIDRKTDDIAFISGEIAFRDGSILDIKEYVESTEFGIIKYKHGYNYRINSNIIFRSAGYVLLHPIFSCEIVPMGINFDKVVMFNNEMNKRSILLIRKY